MIYEYIPICIRGERCFSRQAILISNAASIRENLSKGLIDARTSVELLSFTLLFLIVVVEV